MNDENLYELITKLNQEILEKLSLGGEKRPMGPMGSMGSMGPMGSMGLREQAVPFCTADNQSAGQESNG